MKIMRKLNMALLSALMTVSMLPMNASAASYSDLTSEEKAAFSKIYQDTDDRTLQSVSVKYTTEASGLSNINNYHWTAWYTASKNASINKTANGGRGTYLGFSKAVVDSWSTDKYKESVKSINNGQFPASKAYTWPVDTSSDQLKYWVNKAGFYNILRDPRYAKITLKGFRNFTYTYKQKEVKEEKNNKTKQTLFIYDKTSACFYPTGNATSTYKNFINGRASQILSDTGLNTSAIVEGIKNNWKNVGTEEIHKNDMYVVRGESYFKFHTTQDNIKKEGTIYAVAKKRNEADVENDKYYSIALSWNVKTTTTSYKTITKTAKQQIAQTVVAQNAYASEIYKWDQFRLVPKSTVSSSRISKSAGGFWGSFTPYYHNGNTSVKDEGSYSYTYSTGGSNALRGASVFLYYELPEKYKYIQNLQDSHPVGPDGNPTSPDDHIKTTYTIKYDANGGSGAPQSQKKEKNKTLTLSKQKPVRAGYTFLGWSTAKFGNGVYYAPGSAYKVNASATLYAQWKKNGTTDKPNGGTDPDGGGDTPPACESGTYCNPSDGSGSGNPDDRTSTGDDGSTNISNSPPVLLDVANPPTYIRIPKRVTLVDSKVIFGR